MVDRKAPKKVNNAALLLYVQFVAHVQKYRENGDFVGFSKFDTAHRNTIIERYGLSQLSATNWF